MCVYISDLDLHYGYASFLPSFLHSFMHAFSSGISIYGDICSVSFIKCLFGFVRGLCKGWYRFEVCFEGVRACVVVCVCSCLCVSMCA